MFFSNRVHHRLSKAGFHSEKLLPASEFNAICRGLKANGTGVEDATNLFAGFYSGDIVASEEIYASCDVFGRIIFRRYLEAVYMRHGIEYTEVHKVETSLKVADELEENPQLHSPLSTPDINDQKEVWFSSTFWYLLGATMIFAFLFKMTQN